MGWIEDAITDILSSFPGWMPADYSLLRLVAFALAVDSRRFRKEKAKKREDVFHRELDRYVAADSAPSFARKHIDETLRHQRQLGELALPVMAPLDKESRLRAARAIEDESWAPGGSYDAWVEHIFDRLKC
jgi:RecB family exonuclease